MDHISQRHRDATGRTVQALGYAGKDQFVRVKLGHVKFEVKRQIDFDVKITLFLHNLLSMLVHIVIVVE